MTTEARKSELFPPPCSPPSNLIPGKWPGIAPENIDALRQVLSDNHRRWHIFFNDRNYHNHIAHHALAIWAMGGAGDVIKAGYKRDSSYQRPLTESPGKISEANFKDHLGDSQYYSAYLDFFTELISEHGASAIVEKFIFSKGLNHDSKGGHPDMLGRLLGGLLHPMIHIGYGLEFCLPGMTIEGLAQTAVTRENSSACVPSSFFDDQSNVPGIADKLRSLIITNTPVQLSAPGVHVFTVLNRVLNDPELSDIQDHENKGVFTTVVTEHGETLAKHMKDWHVDSSNQDDLKCKIEQLSWMNSLIYAVGGLLPGDPFKADFFHLHLVTSSLFLPAYVDSLTLSSKSILLRSYLFTSLGWWVSRGRPSFDIKNFYEKTTAYPMPLDPIPSPSKDALLSDDPKSAVPNPWLPIVENAIVHPDDHFPKIQRSFAHYASVYGGREAGQPDFTNTELKEAALLDGTLFLRAAALTDKKMGRVRLGEESGKWD